MKYRSEIDGLRALAVVPVILFHAGFKAFSGGFVGVDVFFVISGYLITTILLNDLQAGKFSIVHFYERRARRILPALFLVMLGCLPFAWFWLLPQDLRSFSQSLVAVSVFASNILFWRSSGYFDTATELKPLIHTWSLSVEEQYYVLFPLFLFFAWKLGKRWTVGILAVVAVVSLALAQWYVYKNPSFTFYMLPTRAWELLIGAFVAFYYSEHNIKKHKYWASELGSLFGFALIGYATFAYSDQIPFPSLYALVPTIGASLVIVFATNKTLIGKLLSTKPFLWIGLISYSAYLWHQPLFAFARQRSLEEPSQQLMGLIAIITLPLAYLTWRFVERPFRNKHLFSRKQIFFIVISFSVTYISIGSLGFYYLNKTSWATYVRVHDCLLEDPRQITHSKKCFSQVKDIILWGDSHAASLYPGLSEYAKEKKLGLTQLTESGCPPLLNLTELKNRPSCNNVNLKIIDFIKTEKPRLIIMHAAWINLGNPITIKGLTDSFEATVKNIQKVSPQSKIIVISNVPRWSVDSSHMGSTVVARKFRQNLKYYSEGIMYADAYVLPEIDIALGSSSKKLNIEFISPTSLACKRSGDTQKLCPISEDDSISNIFYIDYGHLSLAGSLFYTNAMRDYLVVPE